MAKKRVSVTQESKTGLNQRFQDNSTNKTMTRGEFNREISAGNYPDYHTMKRDGKNIPRSNPDHTKKNNLG